MNAQYFVSDELHYDVNRPLGRSDRVDYLKQAGGRLFESTGTLDQWKPHGPMTRTVTLLRDGSMRFRTYVVPVSLEK